jgi:predicted permease
MRFAFRSLRRRPAFALAGVLTIALGIGANIAVFNVVYSVLLRPLPFRNPNQLVQIWETHPAIPQLQVTAPDFKDWRDQSRSFEGLAAYTLAAMNSVTLLGRGEPEIVRATMASSTLFPLMGIRPIFGRTFDNAEEHSKEHVALISERLWRQKFHSNPAIIGQQIRLDTESFRLVGVIGQKQVFPEWAQVWMPLSLMEPELSARRKYHPLEVIGRLKHGVTIAEAQAEMQALVRRLAHAYPKTNATIGAYVIPLSRELTKDIRPSLLFAWGAVGLVLLIACANMAHLFLTRLTDRHQEMRIREALGAQAGHLIQELLSESFLVVLFGGVAGIVLAQWAGELLPSIAANQIPKFEGNWLEIPGWFYAIGVSAIAGVIFGIPTTWQLLSVRARLWASGRSITRERSRLSAAVLAGEVAVAVLVLSGTALVTKNFAVLINEDPGFKTKGIWVIPNLPLQTDWTKASTFWETQLAPALRKLPGVTAVAAVNSAPMTLAATEHSRFATRFGIEGRTFDPGSYPVAQSRWSTPEYFHVLGIPLMSGRWLSEGDRNKPRILVNQVLARRFFPNQPAVGKRLILGVMDQKQSSDEIVGVVGDVRDLALDQEVEPTIYSISTGPVMAVLIKTPDGSKQMAWAFRHAIHSVSPAIPVPTIQPLQRNVSESLARQRFALTLLGIFGAMAALLTAGGIYGLLMHSVSARVREFGVRAALGARPGDVISMVLREAIILTAPGLVLGSALALAFARIIGRLLGEVSSSNSLAVITACIFVFMVTVFSAWLPARRAATVDPALALRAE